jgi:kynurenine formamidase
MELDFENAGQSFRCDLTQRISLAKPLAFGVAPPNPWNAPPAAAEPLRLGDFVGDTQSGGSCNVDRVSFVPHCHGTHTETVGHIVDESVFISDVLFETLTPAVVVTCDLVPANDTDEHYEPAFEASDRVVTAAALTEALRQTSNFDAAGLVVRTHRDSQDHANPAFFTHEAMQLIVERGFKHLLVDLPSVDRLEDDGVLSNHRIFWNVEPGSKTLGPTTRINHTITELVTVPEAAADGPYLLNIQAPAFESDAAPTRPIVHPVTTP